MNANIEDATGTPAANAASYAESDAVTTPLPGPYDPGSGQSGHGPAPVATRLPRPPTDADDVLDVYAVARLLHIGRNTVYALVARNAIPHRRLGKQIRFNQAAIMRWLDSWSSQGAKKGQ